MYLSHTENTEITDIILFHHELHGLNGWICVIR